MYKSIHYTEKIVHDATIVLVYGEYNRPLQWLQNNTSSYR